MDQPTSKHLSFIINIAYYAIFVLLFYAFARWALPFVAPFLIAFVVAYALQRPVNFIHRKSKQRIARGVAGTVLVLLISAVLITLVALLGVQLTSKVKDFISFLSAKFSELPAVIESVKNWLLQVAEKLPAAISGTVTDAVNNFSADKVTGALTVDNLLSALKSPLSGAWSTVKKLPVTIVAILITIISCCFLTADYHVIRNFILLQFSKTHRVKLVRTKKLVFFSLGKLVKSYLLIILITTAELALGLGVLKLIGVYQNGYILAISLIIAIIDIVPVLGTGTVLIPWAAISLITRNVGMGVGLLVMYVIITVIRQIIEPKLVAGQFDLPAIVTIASMYIGTRLLGPIGLFLLPITIIILKLLVDEGIVSFFRTSRSVANAEAARTGRDPEEILRELDPAAEQPEHPNVGQLLAGAIEKKVQERKKK